MSAQLRGPGSRERVDEAARQSYARLIDSCITQLKAQGSSRTCNESKEEEEASHAGAVRRDAAKRMNLY